MAHFAEDDDRLRALECIMQSPRALPFTYAFPKKATPADLECTARLSGNGVSLSANIVLKGQPLGGVFANIGPDGRSLYDMTFISLSVSPQKNFSYEALRRFLFWAWQSGFTHVATNSVWGKRPVRFFKRAGFRFVADVPGARLGEVARQITRHQRRPFRARLFGGRAIAVLDSGPHLKAVLAGLQISTPAPKAGGWRAFQKNLGLR